MTSRQVFTNFANFAPSGEKFFADNSKRAELFSQAVLARQYETRRLRIALDGMGNQTRICSVVLTPHAQADVRYRANGVVSLTRLQFYMIGLLWVHVTEYKKSNLVFMGLFKWAAKTTYYSTKKAGRSIARDVRSVTHMTYEHAGCHIRHRSSEAMLKCRKGY